MIALYVCKCLLSENMTFFCITIILLKKSSLQLNSVFAWLLLQIFISIDTNSYLAARRVNKMNI